MFTSDIVKDFRQKMRPPVRQSHFYVVRQSHFYVVQQSVYQLRFVNPLHCQVQHPVQCVWIRSDIQ